MKCNARILRTSHAYGNIVMDAHSPSDLLSNSSYTAEGHTHKKENCNYNLKDFDKVVDVDSKPWIVTYTGKKYCLTDPDPGSIDVETIAHSLSLLCRFAGMTREFYSVGDHSLHVCDLLKDIYPDDYRLQLHGLIHDFTEGLGLMDCIRPLKELLPVYQDLEAKTKTAIYAAFDLLMPTDQQEVQVKWADNTMLATEGRDLLNDGGYQLIIIEQPRAEIVRPRHQTFVEQEIIAQYLRLRALV